MTKMPQSNKKLFWKLGSCSHTMFHIVNRHFDNPMKTKERAADPLAGGIMTKGYQCGMLWGASLGIGAETYRRFPDHSKAVGMAIAATKHVMKSFSDRTKCINCREITGCNWSNGLSIAKYMLTGKVFYCFNLMDNWAPEATRSAIEGLSLPQNDCSNCSKSCATEVARRLGATNEEMIMVAGFAGGLGLSGSGCGALSAAIWLNTISYVKENGNEKGILSTPAIKKIFKAFHEATDRKVLCHEIVGRHFESASDHSEFITNGGCKKIINVLTQR